MRSRCLMFEERPPVLLFLFHQLHHGLIALDFPWAPLCDDVTEQLKLCVVMAVIHVPTEIKMHQKIPIKHHTTMSEKHLASSLQTVKRPCQYASSNSKMTEHSVIMWPVNDGVRVEFTLLHHWIDELHADGHKLAPLKPLDLRVKTAGNTDMRNKQMLWLNVHTHFRTCDSPGRLEWENGWIMETLQFINSL